MPYAKCLNIFLWCVCFYGVCAEIRPKRVVHGQSLTQTGTAYDAIKYFVWIGFGRKVLGGFADAVLSRREMQTERQVCGGALLTSRIVQSACHCFADFLTPRNGYRWATKNDRSFEIVAGWTYVNEQTTPNGIVKYHIHPKCAEYEKNAVVTHDYALLSLEVDVFLDRVTTNTAPAYPVSEMAQTWTDFLRKGTVCLVIGFGRYLSADDNVKSDILRHGWQSIASYMECYKRTSMLKSVSMATHQEINSWTCTDPFGPHLTFPAKGDSGSPVSCDNRYFSLVSMVANSGQSVFNDLVYFAFANAAEYRREMINFMADEIETEHKDIIAPDRWTPSMAPLKYFASNSGHGPYPIDSFLLSFLLFNTCVAIVVSSSL